MKPTIATSAPSVSFSENEAPTRLERASPELFAACAEPKRGKIEMMKKAVLAMHMAIVLMGCGAEVITPPAPVVEAPAMAPATPPAVDAGAPDVESPCYALSSTMYCPSDATAAYWCHSAPGQMESPAPGCWPLGLGDWDGGSVVAGQWCCR